jgi:hypothetical protein
LQITSSAQAKDEAMSIAVICQIEPLVPCRRPTKKQSMPTSSPGHETETCCRRAGGMKDAPTTPSFARKAGWQLLLCLA